MASPSPYGRASTFAFAARNFLPVFLIYPLRRISEPCAGSPTAWPGLRLDNVNAHGSCGAFDDPDRRRKVRGVQIGHLGLRDLLHLLSRSFPDLFLVRRARTLG